MENICRPIEEALVALKIPLKTGVAYGTVWEAGVNAAQYKVPLTDTSVINVNFPLFSFCSMMSKATALLLPHNATEAGSFVSFDLQYIGRKLQSNRALQGYWAKLVHSHAVFDRAKGVPRLRLSYQEPVARTRYLLCQAMELFAVGHEYGHHIEDHSLGGIAGADADFGNISHRHEHEADLISALVSSQIGANPNAPNLFASTGAGAVLMLGATDLVRRAASNKYR